MANGFDPLEKHQTYTHSRLIYIVRISSPLVLFYLRYGGGGGYRAHLCNDVEKEIKRKKEKKESRRTENSSHALQDTSRSSTHFSEYVCRDMFAIMFASFFSAAYRRADAYNAPVTDNN